MGKAIGLVVGLLFLLPALGQAVRLPDPQGPVVEAASKNISATSRIQGCVQDQEGKVVCAVQIQSTAQTNFQITVPHEAVRAISARGFSYPGYLSVEGAQVDDTKTVFALPAGARVAGKLVFPRVAREETVFAAIYLGTAEFRGIPIGQAQAPQAQAPAPGPQPAPSGTWDYRRFTVGPFTFELVSGPRFGCCPSLVFTYSVTASQDATLEMRFNSSRTIFRGGLQGTGGEYDVSGGRRDFLAGIPINVNVVLYPPGGAQQSDEVFYTEFEVFDGKEWQKVVFRNVPIQK